MLRMIVLLPHSRDSRKFDGQEFPPHDGLVVMDLAVLTQKRYTSSDETKRWHYSAKVHSRQSATVINNQNQHNENCSIYWWMHFLNYFMCIELIWKGTVLYLLRKNKNALNLFALCPTLWQSIWLMSIHKVSKLHGIGTLRILTTFMPPFHC